MGNRLGRILQFRPLTIEDYDEVSVLWKRAGIKLTLSDTKPEIEKLLIRNPQTCFVALKGIKIISAVCGSWDGRRGFVHHLAVLPEYQGKGIGREMMAEVERRFNAAGIVKMTFLVEQDNLEVVAFYRKLGYEVREDLIALSKTLRTE